MYCTPEQWQRISERDAEFWRDMESLTCGPDGGWYDSWLYEMRGKWLEMYC